MMVAIDQITKAVRDYLRKELIPLMPWQKALIANAAITLYAENAPAMVAKYRDHLAVQALGVIHEDGMVDIDAIYKAIHPDIPAGWKKTVELPLIGTITISASDVDSIYQSIRQSAGEGGN